MKRVAQRLRMSALVASLVLPTSLAGQVVTRTDLVGTWVGARWVEWPRPDSQSVLETIWTFRSDSTWALRVRSNGVEDTTSEYSIRNIMPRRVRAGRWRLQGDTLRLVDFYPNAVNPRDLKSLALKIARTGEQLRWVPVMPPGWFQPGDSVRFSLACADTLRRVDASKPLPAPSLTPRPITIDRAALVGTWADNSSKQLGGREFTDTVTWTLKANGTWSETRVTARQYGEQRFGYETDYATGQLWEVYPGDLLGFIGKNASTQKDELQQLVHVRLKDQQLEFVESICGTKPRVFKRVSP